MLYKYKLPLITPITSLKGITVVKFPRISPAFLGGEKVSEFPIHNWWKEVANTLFILINNEKCISWVSQVFQGKKGCFLLYKNLSLVIHKFFTTKKDVFCLTENAWLGAVLVTKQKGCACVNFGLNHNGQGIQILSGNYK